MADQAAEMLMRHECREQVREHRARFELVAACVGSFLVSRTAFSATPCRWRRLSRRSRCHGRDGWCMDFDGSN